MYRKEPLARIFDKMQPAVPQRLKKTYSRLFYSHFMARAELDRLLSGREEMVVKVGRLSCPRQEWDGTHLLAMMCRPPIANMAPIKKFDELLECSTSANGTGLTGYILPSIILSIYEADQISVMFSECGFL